jgi:hypothetical protein
MARLSLHVQIVEAACINLGNGYASTLLVSSLGQLRRKTKKPGKKAVSTQRAKKWAWTKSKRRNDIYPRGSRSNDGIDIITQVAALDKIGGSSSLRKNY